MKNLKKHVVFFSLLAFFAICMVFESHAAFVSPTKVFIHDGRTSASVSIANTSDETLVYTFEWERRARSKDGKGMHLLQDGETFEGYRPADPYLVYSPRRVVVEPGETQRVRVFARRSKDMPPGEYRSHLKITADNVEPGQKNRDKLRRIRGHHNDPPGDLHTGHAENRQDKDRHQSDRLKNYERRKK